MLSRMTNTPRLVLASTSAYRRALLERLDVPFEAVQHRCDEGAIMTSRRSPEDIVRTLARAKAESIAAAHPDAYVLGSDQVVDFEGDVLGKPGTTDGALDQLRRLAGREHRLVTAAALRYPNGGFDDVVDVHRMRMRALSEDELARYVERDRPIDCAGAYKIESLGIALFESIEGHDFTAIVGLPLLAVVTMLRTAGFRVP